MKRIGEFYREKVLTLPDKSLVRKLLPNNSGEIKIKRNLFGWRLYSGKDFVECRSEEEARYLKVFLDAGLREVRVPKDDKYLQNILPELEKLKIKTDEVINSYLESILDRRIREKLRYEVYMELIK